MDCSKKSDYRLGARFEERGNGRLYACTPYVWHLRTWIILFHATTRRCRRPE